jgi:3-isopropylmalate/(R)-2-methylmalate dehydratase small subunit
MSESVSKIKNGDELKIDPIDGVILNVSTGEEYRCSILPENIMELVKDGGLIPHLKKR